MKNLHLWLPAYLHQIIFRRVPRSKSLTHLIFCFVDHFEPDWNHADPATQSRRVQEWIEKYPSLAQKHRDSDGRHPQHTFFYPIEVYVKEHLDQLAGLCRKGFGEVEIHLHHDHDTPEGLRRKIEKGKKDFEGHGLLGRDRATGETRFGFIHGNWALNNSRRDGRWCGVNDESNLLKNLGCYADFTFPSAPSDTQPGKINSLYYAVSQPDRPRAHDRGIDVQRGKKNEQGLMIIQGPLALNWKRRRAGIIPKIENGDITGANPPALDRIDLWIDQRISVVGREDWIFVKIHTHGATERNAPVLLGREADQMFGRLETAYNDGKDFALHYVSAREMYNMIKAAEAGESGRPGEYRDYEIARPG